MVSVGVITPVVSPRIFYGGWRRAYATLRLIRSKPLQGGPLC